MNKVSNYFSTATKNNLELISYQPLNVVAVLRRRKEAFEGNTLDAEGKFMGFGYRVRSMEETAAFTKQLKDAGVPVPEIYESGNDYIIEQYIVGKPLSEALSQNVNFKIAQQFLNQVVKAHERGLVVAERWGKNEILTPKGEIVFIDLDIEYVCDFAKELELAEAVNAVAVFSKDHKMSRWLKKWLLSDNIRQSYNIDKILWLLKKHIEFWKDEGGYLGAIL